jgi:hypothetical protein
VWHLSGPPVYKATQKTIWKNANLFVSLEQDSRNLNYFYRDHRTDLHRNDFSGFCRQSWAEKFGSVTISVEKVQLRSCIGWAKKTFAVPPKNSFGPPKGFFMWEIEYFFQ